MLRVLTFNISGANVSALSPAAFGLREKYERIAQLVRQHSPHVVALQEVAEWGPLAEELQAALADGGAGPVYTLAASTDSHCGLCQVYVQERLNATGGKAVGPVALCKIPLPLPPEGSGGGDGTEPAAGGEAGAAQGGRALPYFLYFAGCHLEPFAEGAEDRLLQIEALLREAPPRARLVLAGDFNMRVSENAAVEALGLVEAWQQVGAPKSQAYSWDTRANLYYGPDTRRYSARYDRVYVRGLEATSFKLVANEPLTPAGDYLSDHFGLLTELRLAAGPVPSPALGKGAAAAARKRKLSPSAGRAAAEGHPPRQLFGGGH